MKRVVFRTPVQLCAFVPVLHQAAVGAPPGGGRCSTRRRQVLQRAAVGYRPGARVTNETGTPGDRSPVGATTVLEESRCRGKKSDSWTNLFISSPRSMDLRSRSRRCAGASGSA